MVNTGTEAFTISGALHTYLAVGDIREVRIGGQDGTDYRDIVSSPPKCIAKPAMSTSTRRSTAPT
jgi:D-hexose-6-phosphate mutarotase